MKKFQWFFVVCIALIIVACSTEKNTLLSRSYHGMTAHYNGYFNANELIDQTMKGYHDNLKENFYEVLPIEALPNDVEAKNMYTPLDTAVSKCAKVISKHAMPSMEKPSAKREEHNKWIDENWITIGKAQFYKRDYDLAYKNFDFAQRFFFADKSAFESRIWIARTYIQQKKYTDAFLLIEELEKAKKNAEEAKHEKKEKTKKKKSKSKTKKKEEKKPALFPKLMNYDLLLTKAMYFEAKEMPKEQKLALEEALKFCKTPQATKRDRARIHFILGQLNESENNREAATKHFGKVLRNNATYEMAFQARMKRALNLGGTKTKKSLEKMGKDPKNSEFRDQVYYTLALIAVDEGNIPEAKKQFSRCALFSTTNTRQKGMAYEKLGDMSFQTKDYVSAQKYYDSCARVIPETYPNAEGIKNKAKKLETLVLNIETASYQDSILEIASLSPKDREEKVEKVIKLLKEKEAERKRYEAEKLAYLQKEQEKKANQGRNGKWYFSNVKARQEGYDEFKRTFGQRENEDDWRRSDKIVFSQQASENDSLILPPIKEEDTPDSMTVESLLAKLPVSDSALQASRAKMMEARFNAGKIYLDQLNENKLALDQFDKITSQTFEDKHRLMAAFEKYRMYEASTPEANREKDFIMLYYPTSEYAGFLNDPDYFIKKREREKLAEIAYLKDLDRYERGLFLPVVTQANMVIYDSINEQPMKSKYMLLKVMAMAKMEDNKQLLLPPLNDLISLYPASTEGKRAIEIKKIITEGYSKNLPADFTKKENFIFNKNDKLIALIFLEEKVNINIAKPRIADFNSSNFGKYKVKTSARVYGKDNQNVIMVSEFPDIVVAKDYQNTFKGDIKTLKDVSRQRIIMISSENMKILFEKSNLEEYELFFDQKY